MQAPELGLFLDECIFKSYNDRWGNDREAQISLSDFQDQVDAFKVSHGSRGQLAEWENAAPLVSSPSAALLYTSATLASEARA